MMRKSPLAVLFLIATLSAATHAVAAGCQLTEVDPGLGKFQVQGTSIDLGEGDDPTKPQAWQGPVSITGKNGQHCELAPEVSIVQKPLFANADHLLLTTYSGSEQMVFSVSLSSCKTLWHSDGFNGTVKVQNGKLLVGGRKIALKANCAP